MRQVLLIFIFIAFVVGGVSCDMWDNAGYPAKVRFNNNGGEKVISGQGMNMGFSLRENGKTVSEARFEIDSVYNPLDNPETWEGNLEGPFLDVYIPKYDTIVASNEWLTAKMVYGKNDIHLYAKPKNTKKKRTVWIESMLCNKCIDIEIIQ